MTKPTFRWIDVSNWDRALHYQVFRDIPQPQYCVTFDLDISHFLPKVREMGCSLTFSMVYAVARCANEIEAFRCRFVDGVHIGKLSDRLQKELDAF